MQRYFQERLRAAAKELPARKSRDTNETKPERLQMKTNYTNFIVVRGLALGMGIACALCSTGCNTIVSEHQPIKTEIVTDPPGARIEINGEYIGDAPIGFAFHQDGAGNVVGNYEIRAAPVDQSQQPQFKRLDGSAIPLTVLIAPTPSKLFFDLRTRAAFVASKDVPGPSSRTENSSAPPRIDVPPMRSGLAAAPTTRWKDTTALPVYSSADYVADSGHWIDDVMDDGNLIKLEDGSLWKVSPTDVVDSALWLPVTDITVIDSDDPEYPYKLVNTDDNEVVDAQLIK